MPPTLNGGGDMKGNGVRINLKNYWGKQKPPPTPKIKWVEAVKSCLRLSGLLQRLRLLHEHAVLIREQERKQ